MSSEAVTLDPEVADAISRAEHRRRMLERLSAAGLRAAEYLAHRASVPEVGDEAPRDGLAFAKVARAVRLSLILEGKLDEQILALRGGAPLDAVGWIEPARASGGLERPARLEDAGADRDRERSGEPVVEREYDRLPSGGFRACVETICDDLGLEPDWSCWSDEEGFIREDGQPMTEWPSQSSSHTSAEHNQRSFPEERLSSPTQPRSGEDRGRDEAPRGRPDG